MGSNEFFQRQFIAGKWCNGSKNAVLKNRNPWNLELLSEITLADHSDLDIAYAAAENAQKSWAQCPARTRAKILLKAVEIMDNRHDEIVEWLIAESGSTRTKAELEFSAVREGTFTAAFLPSRVHGLIKPVSIPGKESRVYRSPVGVIGVISPWNWPMHLTNRSVAPALALGNAVVVKPADDTPVTGGLLLASIYEEAGLPPGLLNIVVGEVADIGDPFILHPVPSFISFTGSTRVGRHIGSLAVSGKHIKRVGLELGGNAPCVVLDDADIGLAVTGATVGRFLHQGQICMSTNRIIVDKTIYDEFTGAFVERVSKLKCGNPADPDTVIGPLINQRQADAALSRIQAARQHGHRVLLEGEASGRLIPPHIFADVPNDSCLAQTEQFAPVASIIRAEDEDHALRLANETEFGLSSAVFTRDEARGLKFASGIHAGMTHINDITPNDDPDNMFGGEKNSGIGRFNSDWIIHEFTREQWITVQREARHYPF